MNVNINGLLYLPNRVIIYMTNFHFTFTFDLGPMCVGVRVLLFDQWMQRVALSPLSPTSPATIIRIHTHTHTLTTERCKQERKSSIQMEQSVACAHLSLRPIALTL